MKTLSYILLSFCIIAFTSGFILKPEEKIISKRESYFNHFLQQTPGQLNITTQCNSVNLSQYYDGVVMSGYLNVGIKNSSSALGFIFFGAKGLKPAEFKKRPTIIWIEGGPGCSSQYGNFHEIGPLKIIDKGNGNFSFKQNPYAWTNDYNVIFVDQPVGTGISYAQKQADIPVDENQVAQQFYNALNELYETKNGCFNQLGINGKESPLFIYGISYAGKYIPSIAQYIVQMGNKFNLKGIGMGDGFVSPYFATESVNQYSYDMGLQTYEQYSKNTIKVKAIQKIIKDKKDFPKGQTLFDELCAEANPKNVDIYKIDRNAFPGAPDVESLMNSQYGQKLFNLKLNQKFEACVPLIYSVFANDFIQDDIVPRVNYLLQKGIHVHTYSGDLDMIVPYYSAQLWIPTLQWCEVDKFIKTPIRVLRSGSTVYGVKQQYDRLTSTIVFNAGHMVTEDQPEAGLELIRNDIKYVLSLKN